MSLEATTVQRVRRTDLVPGYRLIQMVGKGGMGEVHQAMQLSLGRTVAVKLLATELAQDESFVARFEKEGDALGTLRHPNIVSIVDRGKTADSYFLVMEYVDGPSLRERMRDPDFDAARALTVLAQIAKAIDYAHGRGVIHRDLKPENILFDDPAGGVAKVTDFGLAALDERSDVKKLKNLTQTHMSMGTEAYMAPEQRVDAKTAGPRADVYSLGVMLYELLVGEVPLGTFDPPSVRKPALDKRLDAIVAKCLKPAVDDRYASVSALLADLEPLVPMTVGPRPTKETGPQRAVRKAKSVVRSIWRGVTVAAVVSLLVVIATAYARARFQSKQVAPGVALMSTTGNQFLLSATGRFDKAARSVALGDGPDTITVKTHGRPVELVAQFVSFSAADSGGAGRVVLDAQPEGDGLLARTVVDTQARPTSVLEPLYSLFRGPRRETRAALILHGGHERYVALIVSPDGSDPLLDWSLGPDRRGRMTAPLPTGSTNVALELRVDPVTGTLSAIVGSNRDARVLGDPIALGPGWLDAFADEFPRVGVGCLEGACTFHGLSLEGLVKPKPVPPEPAEAPTAAPSPGTKPPAAKPLPKPTVVAAKPFVRPTTQTPPAARPPSLPFKKPAAAPAPKHK